MSYSCPAKLYKYTSCNGLLKTLEKQRFRLSRPTYLNDPLDMYLQETLGMDEVVFGETFKSAFFDYILGDIDYDLLRATPRGQEVILLHEFLKTFPPDVKQKMREEVTRTKVGDIYDMPRIQKHNLESVELIRRIIQNDGIFCSTTDNNNLLMWAHYADQHRGAVIEFTPSVKKDSAMLMSKAVHYTNVRPVLYDQPIDMIAHAFTMNAEESAQRHWDRLVYTKSEEWSYEREYRLSVPRLIPDQEEYATLAFYPEELTAIFMGCRMPLGQRQRVTALAEAINPSVELYNTEIAKREFRLVYIGSRDA